MAGLNPTLVEEGQAYVREQRKEIRLIERLVDRCAELEWEVESLRRRMNIIYEAREQEALDDDNG